VQQATKSFRSKVLLASVLGLVVSVGGLVLAWYFDTVPGATIVLSAIGVFAVMRIAGVARHATSH
jgi:zinc transport system permease protein